MAKNIISSDIALQPADPVNLEFTFTFRKISTGSKPKIQFSTPAPNSNWQPVEWVYDSVANRDADYALIYKRYVQSINELEEQA